MNIKKLQPAKILIFVYCISIVILALRDFRYIYVENPPFFYFNFLVPLLIAVLTSIAYVLKRKRKLFYSYLNIDFSSANIMTGIILLQAIFTFSLVMVWHSVSVYTNLNIILFVVIAILSNSLFIAYGVLCAKERRSKTRATITSVNRISTVSKGKSKKIEYERITELLGFSSDVEFEEVENGYVFIIPEEHIYADFFERIKVVYDEVFKGISIVLKLKNDSLLSLDIMKRDSVFSQRRNQFSFSPLSNVYTLNSQTPEIWESLLSNPIFQQNLLLLRPYFEHFSLKGEYIEALIYTDKAIIKLLDWIMELNPSMEKMSKNIDSSDADLLLCYNCQDPFDPLEETCNKCGSARPRCVVCFQDLKPEEEDDVVELPCCKIYAHKNHILTWLRKKPICPYCHSSLTRWMNQQKISRGF